MYHNEFIELSLKNNFYQKKTFEFVEMIKNISKSDVFLSLMMGRYFKVLKYNLHVIKFFFCLKCILNFIIQKIKVAYLIFILKI